MTCCSGVGVCGRVSTLTKKAQSMQAHSLREPDKFTCVFTLILRRKKSGRQKIKALQIHHVFFFSFSYHHQFFLLDQLYNMLSPSGSKTLGSTIRSTFNTGCRAFASSASTSSAPRVRATRPASQANTIVPTNIYELTKEYPRHPLLSFFGKESRKVNVGEGKTREEMVPVSLAVSSLGHDRSGRSWLAAELRTKSSLELHQLWYICLMERNKLATTKAEIQRAGALQYADLANYNGKRIEGRIRKTMARIKFVLNERRLALLDAQQKAAEGTLWADEVEGGEDLYEEADLANEQKP